MRGSQQTSPRRRSPKSVPSLTSRPLTAQPSITAGHCARNWWPPLSAGSMTSLGTHARGAAASVASRGRPRSNHPRLRHRRPQTLNSPGRTLAAHHDIRALSPWSASQVADGSVPAASALPSPTLSGAATTSSTTLPVWPARSRSSAAVETFLTGTSSVSSGRLKVLRAKLTGLTASSVRIPAGSSLMRRGARRRCRRTVLQPPCGWLIARPLLSACSYVASSPRQRRTVRRLPGFPWMTSSSSPRQGLSPR